ncbi:MAG: sodium-dependent bicarbonate transport family permease [Gammaproteobacteria bacterium]
MFDAIGAAASANLLAPPVLFFALGALAGWARSDLSIPGEAAKTLSLYLMLCIGFKGGVEAHASGPNAELAAAAALGILFSFATPFAAYAVLHRLCRLDRTTAAATAAHYGSVSVVTFAAGTEFLRAAGVSYSGHMAAVLSLMETPAILAALVIVGAKPASQAGSFKPEIWREVLLNGAAVLLIGSFAIGLLAGEPGMEKMSGFVSGPVFQGALCLFLLDMGLLAARRLAETFALRPALVGFAIAWPVLSAGVALLAAHGAGLSPGDMTLFAVLAASASYIAVPAAMRLALPKADAGVYLPMALAMTFPFNLVAGIPLYFAGAQLLAGAT